MQPGAHGAKRATERLRRIEVAQLVQIAQHHDFAASDGQFQQRSAQGGRVSLSRELDDGIRLDRERLCRLRLVVRQREQSSLTAPAP